MRIRTVKPEFYLHEGLYEAERDSKLPIRVAYSGLWGACDREGRFKWEPRRLGLQIVPYDGVDFARVLDVLVTRGFVVKYEVEGETYGYVPTFLAHQIINNREKRSVLPAPPIELTRQERDNNGSDMCKPHEKYADTGEGKGKEGKGTEGKGGEAPPLPTELPANFPKTIEEAMAAGALVGASREIVVREWNLAVSRGGVGSNGIPIRSWPHHLQFCLSASLSRTNSPSSRKPEPSADPFVPKVNPI